ncbi:MAG: sortase [Anaerolineae bacterium]|nr:sortase [Anaerolineae bacterium]
MRDKRSVDELSIEELERVLAIRRREARQQRLQHYKDQGRRLPSVSLLDVDNAPEPLPVEPRQHEAAEHVPPVEPPVTYDLTGEVPRFEEDLQREARRRQRARHDLQPGNGSAAAATPSGGRNRRTWDRLLLVVEVLAVFGVVLVLFVGGYLLIVENDKLDALEEKSAAIQQEADAMRPTPSPMPDLRVSAYVLPGGHYSPEQTGEVGVFNYDEIPESVRPAIAAQLAVPQTALPTPSASSPAPGRVEIPAIGVSANIYAGDDWFSLQKGVGHLVGSGNPGDNANMVLTAHNDIYGEIFKDIERLEPGDEVRIQARNGRWYTYVVRDKQVVRPADIWVLKPGNEAITTLITCYPYRVDSHRMVVFAELQE